MLDVDRLVPQTALRAPSDVMRLRRMGAAFPTRLSFLRTLLRALAAEDVNVARPVWEIDENGFGHAVYTLSLAGHEYSLVAVSNDLPDDQRTDRVIATAWDTAYVLYDGIPDRAEIERIVQAAPKQEAARFSERDLVLSRANKSVRLFSHVVEALRSGRQPDRKLVRDTGYLMRTTAVYGNGKFGIADRQHIADRPVLSGPFAAEMLTVWLIRGFTHDLVEHMGGAKLDREIKRHLGIGNATGLGMAPFLVSHPTLIDAWMQVRETALARVRAIKALTPSQIERIYQLVDRTASYLSDWHVADEVAQARLNTLREEWPQFAATLTPDLMLDLDPIDTIVTQSTRWSIETQELVVALVLEPFGDLIDGLTECMSTPFTEQLDPSATCRALAESIDADWSWAVTCDFAKSSETQQFWYVSEEKLEPRLGARHDEPGAERESPLDVARRVQALAKDLPRSDATLASFLAQYPEHRFAARRVQTLARHPFSEIRDNLIGEGSLPIDMLRCKLAFFGAGKFDPKSDRWTRITLAQGAPLADELDQADDWWLPVMPA